MAKKKNKSRKDSKKEKKIKPVVQSPLDIHNISNYIEDYAIISKFSHLPFSKREWIETRRYEHQFSANKYEHILGAYLLSHNVKFIHQAPFVICGRIYFLDFFIPSLRVAIEVDGVAHSYMVQKDRDLNRDKDFYSIGIKTIRVSNDEVKSSEYLDIRMKAEGIVR
jgi:very-short-patch-repair endonuclease